MCTGLYDGLVSSNKIEEVDEAKATAWTSSIQSVLSIELLLAA